MEHKSINSHMLFALNITARKPISNFNDRTVLYFKHLSEHGKEKRARVTFDPKEDFSKEEWVVSEEFWDVGLYDSISIKMANGLQKKKAAAQGIVFISHQDLFDACSSSLSNKSFIKHYTIQPNDPNKAAILGEISLELRCLIRGDAHLPSKLYEYISITDQIYTLSFGGFMKKEFVRVRAQTEKDQEKGEIIAWIKAHRGTDLMHGERSVGHLLVKESGVPPVYLQANYFFYHGERLARLKLKNKNLNGMIEFYNGDLPIAITEEPNWTVSLTRNGVLLVKYTFNQTTFKGFGSKFDMQITDPKMFPLAILMSVCMVTRVFKTAKTTA